MTRDEARKAAEIMLAYADGEKIEYRPESSDDMWLPATAPCFDWNSTDYRIKKEPTYRPFKDVEECWNEMQKHQPFGWLKGINRDTYYSIRYIKNDIDYKEAFVEQTFADGMPFGIKEE